MKCIIFVLILFLSVSAKSESKCSELFQISPSTEMSFNHLFPSVKDSYPILARIITNKLYSRSSKIREYPAWKQLENLVKNCSLSPCLIRINSDLFSFAGQVQIIRELNGFILDISVDHFVTTRGKFVRKKKMMNLLDQPQGINMQFVNLMSVLFSSIYYALKNNPEISIVRITGRSVVNNTLAKVLEDMGFKPGSRDPLTVTNVLAATGLMGLIPKIASMHNKGISSKSLKTYGGTKTFLIGGFVVYESIFNKNRVTPRDWVLELKTEGSD